MATIEWYYGEANQQRGPVSSEQLHELARSGRITPETLLWNERMTDWRPAGQVEEVAQLLNGQGAEIAPATVATPDAAPRVTAGAVPVQPVGALPPQGVLGYQAPGQEPLICSDQAVTLLRQTKPWVQFIGVLFYIFAGLTLIGAFGMLVAAGFGRGTGASDAWFFLIFVAVYFLLAVMNVAMGLYLWRYGSGINRLVLYRRSMDLESALAAQKAFWRLVGIASITFIAIYLLIAAVAMAGLLR